LHEANGKHENLNSMESQLQYYHTKYVCITATNEALKTSRHETNLKYENFTVSTYIFYSYIFVVIAKKHLPASSI